MTEVAPAAFASVLGRQAGLTADGGRGDLSTRLFAAALSADGLDAIAAILVEEHGGEVLFVDRDLVVTAASDSLAQVHVSPRVAAALRHAREDLLEISPGRDRASFLCARLRAEERDLGWIVWEPDDAAHDEVAAALQSACLAASAVVGRQRVVAEVEEQLRRELVQALLIESGQDLTGAQEHCLGRPGCIAVIRPLQHRPGALEALHQATMAATANGRTQYTIATSDERIVVVGPEDGHWTYEVHRRLSERIGPTAVGVGPAATSVAGYRESLSRAARAADALAALGRDGVLCLRDPGFEQLIIQSTDAGRLVEFVGEALGPMLDYDRDRRAELIHTLELAFAHGWNLQAAARAAHIHVSTLRYRLSKVEKLTGRDLAVADERLVLQVAIRLSKILGVLPQTEVQQSG